MLEIIENAQTSIKEVVDSDKLVNEVKIYRVMDLRQDMEDVANLQKDCESHAESNNYQDDLKKARVGLINLKAYLGQVDCIEFATAIQNEFLFKVRLLYRLLLLDIQKNISINTKQIHIHSFLYCPFNIIKIW